MEKNLSNSNDKERYALDADILLSSEMEEIEGGAENSCSSCKFLCYSDLI
jgi:hypothetical protein